MSLTIFTLNLDAFSTSRLHNVSIGRRPLLLLDDIVNVH